MRVRSGDQRGFTLVEVMVAILLVMIAIIGVIGLYRVQARSSSSSRHMTEAVTLANDKLEQMRTVVGDPAAICATETNITEVGTAGGIYTRSCTTQPVSTWYELKVTVSWPEDGYSSPRQAIVRGRRTQ